MAGDRSAARGLGAAHGTRRQEILEAVFAIVDSEGTEQVSIRHVAETAGVSVGRVQHYFPSKEALLTEAFTAVNEHGARRVRERTAAQDVEEDARGTLRAVLTELIPHTDDDRRLFRVAQAFETYALTRPHLGARLADDYDKLAALLALLLGTVAHEDTGPHTDAPPEHLPAARTLLAMAVGLGNLTVLGALAPSEAQQLAYDHLERTMRGLRSAPTDPEPDTQGGQAEDASGT